VAEEAFYDLDAPIKRVAAECVPIPFASHLEDAVVPTVDRLTEAVRRTAEA
jgi:pyruvate dehydrogenase E1 component beta subunit